MNGPTPEELIKNSQSEILMRPEISQAIAGSKKALSEGFTRAGDVVYYYLPRNLTAQELEIIRLELGSCWTVVYCRKFLPLRWKPYLWITDTAAYKRRKYADYC